MSKLLSFVPIEEANWRRCAESREVFDAYVAEVRRLALVSAETAAARAISQTIDNERRAVSKGSPAYTREFLDAALIDNVSTEIRSLASGGGGADDPVHAGGLTIAEISADLPTVNGRTFAQTIEERASAEPSDATLARLQEAFSAGGGLPPGGPWFDPEEATMNSETAQAPSAIIYRAGFVHSSVCCVKSMTREQIEEFINRESPTGIYSAWRISDSPTFFTGEPNPCVCERDPERVHYLLHC